MKFVSEHLNSQHLFHAPHKWFLAILLSPIHAAELHYERRYHLRFAHAKKLFFFDMSLLAFLFFLFGATIFWHFYDPSIRSLVSLKVEQSQERIKTGSKVNYTISYINRSDIALTSPIVSINLPKGFIINTSTAPANFEYENSSLNLSKLAPGANGSFHLEGTLFGTPDQEYESIVKLSYFQEGDTEREYVIARLFSLPRESPLEVVWDMNEKVLSHGILPFSLHIQNTGEETLSSLRIPLPYRSGINFENVTSSIGIVNKTTWELSLPPKTSSTLKGNIITALDENTTTIELETTPEIFVNGESFPQKKLTEKIQVLHPSLEARAEWKQENKIAKVFDTIPFVIRIHNTGIIDLQNMTVSLPLTALINKTKLQSLNHGTLRGNIFVINKNQDLSLARIKAGETFELTLQISLSASTEGTDLRAILQPEIQAEIAEVPGAIYHKKINSDEMHIASHITLNGALRYYTDEGDQLGRGPLPPQVDQETRYFASIVLENTTSQIENAIFSATLAPGFSWADKSSVSLGKDIVYNAQTRKVSWTASNISAHTNVGISFGVIFTPSANQVGTSPIALQNISLTAKDSFTSLPLSSSLKALDISLPNDSIGRNKGVKVIQ
jgi:hypothetical protein